MGRTRGRRLPGHVRPRGVAGSGARWSRQELPPGTLRDTDGDAHGKGPPLAVHELTRSRTYRLGGAGRPCGARCPSGRGASRESAEGRGVRGPADWGSRPARRRPLRGAETQAGDGSHTPRAPPSSLGAPPCQTGPSAPPCRTGCREGEFLATRPRPTATRPTTPRGLCARTRLPQSISGTVVYDRDP